MEDKFNILGVLIEELDSLAHGLDIPMNPQVHVDELKIILPEKIRSFKNIYVQITGENPWGNS